MQQIQEEFNDSSSFYRMEKTVTQIFVRFVFSIEVRYTNFDTFGVKPRVKLKSDILLVALTTKILG